METSNNRGASQNLGNRNDDAMNERNDSRVSGQDVGGPMGPSEGTEEGFDTNPNPEEQGQEDGIDTDLNQDDESDDPGYTSDDETPDDRSTSLPGRGL